MNVRPESAAGAKGFSARFAQAQEPAGGEAGGTAAPSCLRWARRPRARVSKRPLQCKRRVKLVGLQVLRGVRVSRERALLPQSK